MEELHKNSRDPFYLCLNATSGYVTGLLLQFTSRGEVHVIKDWVYEGDTSERLASVVAAARMELGGVDRPTLRFLCGPSHFDKYNSAGLRQAARQIPIDLIRGQAEIDGREHCKGLLQKANGLKISSQARWTLNGFAAGYAKEITKAGVVTEFPIDNPYRRLIEGLESFCAMMQGQSSMEDQPAHYALSPDGRRYMTSLGGKSETSPSKSNWHDLLRGN